MGATKCERSTIILRPYELSNFFQTLQRNSNFNSPRYLTSEVEKELTDVEQRLQDAYVDQIYAKSDCILVMLTSTHSTGLIMQREDYGMDFS